MDFVSSLEKATFIHFDGLELTRNSAGEISFNWDAIELICRSSGIPLSAFMQGNIPNYDRVREVIIWLHDQDVHPEGWSSGIVDDLKDQKNKGDPAKTYFTIGRNFTKYAAKASS